MGGLQPGWLPPGALEQITFERIHISESSFNQPAPMPQHSSVFLNPDDAGLTARSPGATVGEKLVVVAGGADIQTKDITCRNTRLHKLVAGQSPKIHGAAFFVKPGHELRPPFLVKIDKFRLAGAKTRPTDGKDVLRSDVIALAKAHNA